MCENNVEGVERLHYVHNIDTFNAMSKGSKDYVMLKKRTYTFLLITFLIFKRFSKEALTVLIVTHVTHVERVERSLNSSNCYSCYSC